MKILVVGSGGREHALVWKLSKSGKASKIYSAPGNGGILSIAECVDIDAADIKSLVNFALEKKIDYTIVGPEAALVAGIAEEFQRNNLRIFGPSMPASEIEGSKSFAKNFMKEFGIPTASCEIFEDKNKAVDYIKSRKFPIVIKADGLSAGKGVKIALDLKSAVDSVEEIMGKKVFGEAGNKIVVEEYLEGEEATVLAFTDGITVIPMVPSQDHKRIYDNDLGPNTGGMGAYAPAPVVSGEIIKEIENEILIPTIRGLESKGRKYKGVIYVGLMITKDGVKVLEYNCRFGDPETQVVLPLLETDLLDIIEHIIFEELHLIDIKWSNKSAAAVVAASHGYPGKYEKGMEIKGIESAEGMNDIVVFHAGTANVEGKYFTTGGRVLAVSAIGENLKEAVVKAYLAVNKIKFEGMQFRKDIGHKALKKGEI